MKRYINILSLLEQHVSDIN